MSIPPIFEYNNNSYARITGLNARFYREGYGPMGFGHSQSAKRVWNHWQGGHRSLFDRYYNDEAARVANDPETIEQNARTFGEQTSWWKRWFGTGSQNQLDDLLENEENPAIVTQTMAHVDQKLGYKGAALDRVVNHWTFGIAGWQHNDKLGKIVDSAVEAMDPHIIAMLVKKAGDGLKIFDPNSKVIQEALVDSKEKLGEEKYNQLMYEVAIAFKKINNGEDIDRFLKRIYTRGGLDFGFINLGGVTAEGEEIRRTVRKARTAHKEMHKNMHVGGMPPPLMPFTPRPMLTG